MCVKIFHFKYVDFGQPVSRIPYFELRTYVNKQLNNDFLRCIALSWSKLTKMSDNSNNVRSSGVRFFRSPYLVIKSALASLGRY